MFSRTQKANGTYEGSQVGNFFRRSASAITGMGPQTVMFDFTLGKFKVNVNPGLGKKNFQIIGNDASELKADYQKKIGAANSSLLGKAGQATVRTTKKALNVASRLRPQSPLRLLPARAPPASAPVGGKRKTRRS
jgi:hypothetical protein